MATHMSIFLQSQVTEYLDPFIHVFNVMQVNVTNIFELSTVLSSASWLHFFWSQQSNIAVLGHLAFCCAVYCLSVDGSQHLILANKNQ